MNTRIIFSDNIHFHKNNFKSLMEFVENEKIEHYFNEDYKDWMSLYGNYSSVFSSLKSIYDLIKTKSVEELYAHTNRDIKIYNICRAELKAYLIPAKKLYNVKLPQEVYEEFSYLYTSFHTELCMNMAASIFWIEFWYDKLIISKRKYTHAFTFSGSSIYSKSLIEICKYTITRCVVAETSLTGNDYYLEEKYSHLANNSDIMLPSVRYAYENKLLEQDYLRLKTKAINKLILSKNKNVIHPVRNSNQIGFNDFSKPTVLIIGQVVNDYSILETNLSGKSTILIYKELISQILRETDNNIIFKAHPWEEKKTHCGRDITYSEIITHIDTLGEEYSGRCFVTKDFNLDELFEFTSHVVLINSQAGIEAAFHGIKPIVLGSAYYGGAGFTFDVNNSDQVTYILKNESGSLTLDEFDRFEVFLTIYLEFHLFSIHKSGLFKIKNRLFEQTNIIKIASPIIPKLNLKTELEEEFVDLTILVKDKEQLDELSNMVRFKNAIVYLLTDIDKFKRKFKSNIM